MIDVTNDIHSMTAFKRDSTGLLEQMRKSGRPLVLTINGKAEAVVLDAASYRDVAEHLDTVARIRRGLEQAKKGMGRSVDEVFADLERES
ncbi:MAG: type II toxin-antitoxin system prevent-host-death family antitoxin [Acidobacteria bacterium]|nr:type II toxin-antitoxin system prevent-host-death family antitoxin [Acidobacteriota bacterium]